MKTKKYPKIIKEILKKEQLDYTQLQYKLNEYMIRVIDSSKMYYKIDINKLNLPLQLNEKEITKLTKFFFKNEYNKYVYVKINSSENNATIYDLNLSYIIILIVLLLVFVSVLLSVVIGMLTK